MSAKNIGLDTAIAVIEPDSYFTRSYTVTYPRRIFDPMKYTFDVDAEYSFEVDPVKTQPKSDGSNTGYQGVEHHVGGASAIALISPLPLVLSLFALGSSIIGAYLNSLISFNKQGELIPGKLTINTLVTAPIIAAPLIAFIFYNVYEYTDIGKKIQVGVGWRGAVLIGAMCGLFEERILKAMSVFIKG